MRVEITTEKKNNMQFNSIEFIADFFCTPELCLTDSFFGDALFFQEQILCLFKEFSGNFEEDDN